MEPLSIKDIINSVNIPSYNSQKVDNILAIAGIDHLENAWSRIYAYFLKFFIRS